MLGSLLILVYPLLYQGINGQDHTCSKTWESSCPAVTPLVSGTVCPNGFDLVEKQCFKVKDNYYSEMDNTYNNSIEICEALNAKLAEPRELFDSAEFLKYLFVKGGHFSLGGYYTNNSWEWLTGGKIDNKTISHIEGYYETDRCLKIGVYYNEDYYHYWYDWYENWDGDYDNGTEYDYYYYWYEYRELIPINLDALEFDLYGDSCEYSYRYICQAVGEYSNYLSCNHNGKILPSGTLVSMDGQQCQQSWCQDGVIIQYGCGDNTNSCCVYKGKLYGDGDAIGPIVPRSDCNGCKQRVCQAGDVQWQECKNCSVSCCLFNGKAYQPGSHIPNACARLVCDGTTGEFEHLNHGIDIECPKCKVYLDPHIVIYDQKYSSYSYQGCGNYSLSQDGNTYSPTLAVYATFKPCGGSSYLSCVDTVVFKNDNHAIITLRYDSNGMEIEVNGDSIGFPHSSPSILQSMGSSYPILIWGTGDCVNLQGSSGILVKFCGSSWANQVYIWAYPDVTSVLEGLCGTVTGDPNEDFKSRNGIIYSPWERNPPLEFPISWLTTKTSDGSCEHRDKREVQTQNECDVNTTVLANYNSQCAQAVGSGFSNAEEDEVQTIIDDCVYDMCNVSDPGEWVRAVQQTAQVQAEIQENTQEFFMTTTFLPTTRTITTTFEPVTTTSDISTSAEISSQKDEEKDKTKKKSQSLFLHIIQRLV